MMNRTNICLDKSLQEDKNLRDLGINLLSFDKRPGKMLGNV